MPTSMRLTKGTKVEVFTRREVVSGSWLRATVLSGNGHTYRIQYDDYPPGMPRSYDRVPRKVVRLLPPPPPPTKGLLLRIKIPPKAAEGAEQVLHEVPEMDDDDDDMASVDSNSPHHRAAGSGERRWSHRDDLEMYRIYMRSLYEAGPSIPWEQYICMINIGEFLHITLEEHRSVLHELMRSRRASDALSSP